jgi:hypothetical protein
VRSQAHPFTLQDSERVNVMVSPRNKRMCVPGAGDCVIKTELFIKS